MGKPITLKDLLGESGAEAELTEVQFEEGLKLLEELVSKVESGTLSLDKSITAYEKGVKIIEVLRKLLSGAEEKLKILQKPLETSKA